MKKETLNKAQEIQQRIEEMTRAKNSELAKIAEKKGEAQARKEKAEAKLKEATEQMDLEAYEEAKAEINKEKTAIDMYSGRYSQIAKQEYISEEESDSIIDSLLQYERELDTQFIDDIREPLEMLQGIRKQYLDAIFEAERTIRAWETTIHANYSTRGAMRRIDKTTGQYTDRSEQPIFVHRSFYRGCKEAEQLENYLKKSPL